MSNGKHFQVLPDFQVGINPTITMWNRVEGRPRKEDFSRALRAEIRDPLWMLTRQWQMGEFLGDDAGSPILAKIYCNKKRLRKFQPAGNASQMYRNNIPLEGLVEQMPVPFVMNEKVFSLDIRIMMGRYWLKLIGANRELAGLYAGKYPVRVPESPVDEQHADILAHPESWQKFAAAASRKMDGYEFYLYLTTGKPGVDEVEIDDETIIEEYREAFIQWVNNFFLQPMNEGQNAYLPSRLEYQFRCSVPFEAREKVYKADGYHSGHLDWFNLTLDDSVSELHVEGDTSPNAEDEKAEKTIPVGESKFTFIPVNIDYEGMPDTRWWKFEDRKTFLGDIKPDTTDISKLFLEFTLFYANDWFMIPQPLPAASISEIKGLVVTNCFGERTLIEPAGRGADNDWQRWTMFAVNREGTEAVAQADHSLLMLPTVLKIQEGPPIESVVFVRDEIANMVWAIETDITLPSGDTKKGIEAARELSSFYDRLFQGNNGGDDQESMADIRYQLMNTVPENWIPFIPVHVDHSQREIQLQRASMPRMNADNTFNSVKPRTTILRIGLDENERVPYFVFEEEVPRAGIQVKKSFQRTRWHGGKVFNWIGIHKETGRGEGLSGLRFDQIIGEKR